MCPIFHLHYSGKRKVMCTESGSEIPLTLLHSQTLLAFPIYTFLFIFTHKFTLMKLKVWVSLECLFFLPRLLKGSSDSWLGVQHLLLTLAI